MALTPIVGGETGQQAADKINGNDTYLESKIDTNTTNVNNNFAKLIVAKNKIDKNAVVAGQWLAGGTFNTSNSFIRTPLFPVVGGQDYILSGVNALSNVYTRFVFFDASNVFISSVPGNGSTTQVAVVPSNAAYIGITVGQGTNIGLTPTSNIYTNTMQLETGTTPTTWETYKKGVDANSLIGQAPNTVTTTTFESRVVPLETFTNVVKTDSYTTYSEFNGTGGIVIGTTYSLSVDGDSVEFTSRMRPDLIQPDYGLGMFGTPGSTTNNFGYYNKNRIDLRGSAGGAYISFLNLPDLSTWRTIKLSVINSGTQWQLTIDGVNYTPQTKTASLDISVIATAYGGTTSRSLVDMQNFKIITAGGTLDAPDPSSVPGAFSVPKRYTKKLTDLELPPVYVSYNPTGIGGKELFTVYVKRENANTYLGFLLVHDYNMDPVVYKDIFRIAKADEYRYDGIKMILVASNALATGESECTWRQQPGVYPKADNTGGTHGDELFTEVFFYMNGVRIDTVTGFDLLPCNEFSYIQKSTMHECANVIAGVDTPVPGHPLQAIHHKHTIFSNSGYSTFNRLIWQAAVPVQSWYHGIACVGKINATTGFHEDFVYHTYDGIDSGDEYAPTGMRTFTTFNSTAGYSAKASSTLLKPANLDSACKVFIRDRTDDSKYYREKADLVTVAVNDVWESIQTVTFNKK